MRLILLNFSVILVWFCKVNAEHLVVGNIAARTVLAHEELVTYNAFPLLKREKTYFYSDPRNRPIKGIQAIDTLHSNASIIITAGGVGQSFVNLLMTSQTSYGLGYNIGIYVSPEYQ